MVTRARLRRRTQHRLVSGVAGGIADRLNAPVGFVRFVILFASYPAPWVIWGYAAATIAIPADGRDRPDWDTLVGLARLGLLFGVPAVVFQGGVSISDPLGGPAGWWVAQYGLAAAGLAALLTADYLRGRARTAAETRSVVLAGAPVVVCGLAFGAAVVLAPDVRWEHWLPLVAVVGGAALLIAARRGRVDGFTAPAIVALALTGMVIASNARLEGGVGDSTVTPSAGASGRIVARQAVGDLNLDLRQAARSGHPITVDTSVGVGTLTVSVPRGVPVQVDARVGRGTVEPYIATAFGVRQGFDRRLRHTYATGRHPRAAPIRLTAEVGLGTLTITHEGGS
jgi:phage shock protein PspC (stress-responsive transcriptional regulator)